MNRAENISFFILTGGPGSGKTTLLEKLEEKGYKCVPEAARKIIKEQVQINGEALPWKNKELYTGMMFWRSFNDYLEIQKSVDPGEIVFFDRGILDTICYSKMTGQDISEEMKSCTLKCLFNKNVFLLPPWREIYIIDNERKQDWEEAVFTYEKIKEIYLESGYKIIEVPFGQVEDRARFVLNKIKHN